MMPATATVITGGGGVAKVRVYALAKELGVDGPELLRFINSIGEYVKSLGSSIEEPVVRRVRERFASDDQLRLARRIRTESPVRVAQTPHPSQVPPSPVLPLASWWDAASPESPATAAIRRNLGADASPRSSDPRKSASNRTRKPPKVRDRWAEHWFDPDDKLEWQRAGIYEPEDAELAIEHGFTPDSYAPWGAHELRMEAARRAIDLGLTPDQLDHTLNGIRLVDMLRTGSRVDEIRALMARFPLVPRKDPWAADGTW